MLSREQVERYADEKSAVSINGYELRALAKTALAAMDVSAADRQWAAEYQKRMEGVEAERAALKAECARKEAALRVLRDEEVRVGMNEEGEEYVQCDRCEGSAWGGDREDCEHTKDCVFSALTAPAGEGVKS